MKADDDTFVVVDNLRRMLEKFDPAQPHYLGLISVCGWEYIKWHRITISYFCEIVDSLISKAIVNGWLIPVITIIISSSLLKGRYFRLWRGMANEIGYNSGGAGYILSHEALVRLVLKCKVDFFFLLLFSFLSFLFIFFYFEFISSASFGPLLVFQGSASHLLTIRSTMPEDAQLGRQLRKLGIEPGDTRDEHGGQKIFPLRIYIYIYICVCVSFTCAIEV